MKQYNVVNVSQLTVVKAKKKESTLATLGVENPSQSHTVKDKKKQTTLENHGVEFPQQSSIVRKKSTNKCLLTHGVENPSQSTLVQKKKQATCNLHYGTNFPAQADVIKERTKQTCMATYGVEHSLQAPEVRARGIATNLLTYGVEHPSQNVEVMERTQKNAKKYKEFKMPSGAIRKVQGYEPFALRDLFAASYTEEQIMTNRKDVPHLAYDVGGKKRVYFPDIFIPHENKIIEVKSTWTFKCKADNIELKKKACLDGGYSYELWCYNAKGVRVEV